MLATSSQQVLQLWSQTMTREPRKRFPITSTEPPGKKANHCATAALSVECTYFKLRPITLVVGTAALGSVATKQNLRHDIRDISTLLKCALRII